ncbi:pseudouridine synthase [Pseudogemmatithrix spongiicola]|uniref:Pseudouridine synthase n=1 Tax=Pseudogemmatithrix spongiicola TaxID=3062599 RepID=A0AA49JUF9_9BACT|nr:pseudouridine synthase [Gemmatimonadaceae bacterium 'strain 138']WKW14986.1 pseudouridine synthase [Gemmatimonadaceae bacterium 'strain 318']
MSDTAMRIQRALARAGVASRRKAEELVAAGRVRVNGEVARTGQSVEPGVDKITVDGKAVELPPAAKWYVLHKPAGVLTTASDPQGRKTVFELVPKEPGLTYVGRLDYMTEGVLLLTTDGDAAHLLTHPSSQVPRTYVATVRGSVKAAAAQIRAGVELEDGLVTPEAVSVEPGERPRTWDLTLTIREGRTREVRRLCEEVGLEVLRLVRTSFGPVQLGALEPGMTRALTTKERTLLDALVHS